MSTRAKRVVNKVKKSSSSNKQFSKMKTDYSIQSIINNTLEKIIKIEDFKTRDIKTLIKNTFHIYCPRCGSDNVHEEMKQLRSGDEEANHIYKCLNCGNTGKDNFLTHPLKKSDNKSKSNSNAEYV